ncbi:hypothetical protein BH24ACT23_BH24ACT23_00950 [soil metagenome]
MWRNLNVTAGMGPKAGNRTKARRSLGASAAVFAVAAATAWAAAPGVPEVGVDESKKPELRETIPITKKGESKTVLSLPPGKLGPVAAGDIVNGYADVEVTTACLEDLSGCPGKHYGYSPKVTGKLVLAKERGKRGAVVGKARSLTCAQDLPNRNHHCIVRLFESEALAKTPSCAPDCSLNVVLRASSRHAKRGQKLIIGAHAVGRSIDQGKAAFSSAVFPGADTFDPQVTKTTKRVKRSVPIRDGNTDEMTVASMRLDRLEKGEALIVEALAIVSTRGHDYNVLSQGQVVLSEKKNSASNKGIPLSVMSNNGKIATENGFNCTPGRSAHSTPCKTLKSGAARIEADSREHPNQGTGDWVPLHLNFYVGFSEQFSGKGQPWRSGDKAKIKRVKLKVTRYTPS